MWIALLSSLILATPEPGSVEWTLDMHERFAYAAMMRTAFVHDQVDRSKRHAAQLEALLAESKDAGSERVRAAAAKVAGAESLVAQAAAIAATAQACGACHAAHRVQPMFLGHATAPTGNGLTARMGRHIWAADRMWEALIAHSDASWNRGARALAETPFFAGGDALGDRLERVSDLAIDAAGAKTWEERAEVYGRFLAQCAGCHEDYSR